MIFEYPDFCPTTAEGIAIAEIWPPGRPWFLWLDSVPSQSRLVASCAASPLGVGRSQRQRIEPAAASAGTTIAFGFGERFGGSLHENAADPVGHYSDPDVLSPKWENQGRLRTVPGRRPAVVTGPESVQLEEEEPASADV